MELSRYEGVLQMKWSRYTDSQITEALKRVETGDSGKNMIIRVNAEPSLVEIL